jgi:hypothetical protein
MKRILIVLVALFAAACQTTTDTTTATTVAPAATMTADERMEATARAVLSNITAGKYIDAAKDFDTTMMTNLGPTKLGEFAKQLNAQVGAFKSVGTARLTTEEGYRVVVLPATYERANIDVRVVFNADGKVAGLFFRPGE